MKRSGKLTTIERLPCGFDKGTGYRARIGLLVLESDQTIEMDVRRLTDIEGVATYHSPLANDTTVTPETLAKMEAEIPVAASLLPGYLGLNAIGYGCTSGSTMIGEHRVNEIIGRSHPGVPTTNPLTAAKTALDRLSTKRIGLVTPYSPDVTAAMQSVFEASGIEIAGIGSFYEEDDVRVGKIDQKSILNAALSIGENSACEAVFISCTSLRTADLIAKAEDALKKPVTSSNHALSWHLLRLAGVDDRVNGFGQLYQLGLQSAVLEET